FRRVSREPTPATHHVPCEQTKNMKRFMRRHIGRSLLPGAGSISDALWKCSPRERINLQFQENYAMGHGHPLSPGTVAMRLRHCEAGELPRLSLKRGVMRKCIAPKLLRHIPGYVPPGVTVSKPTT